MKERIRELVLALGADLCGLANIDRFADAPEGFHPLDVYADCRSVAVFAKRLPRALARVRPQIAYNRATDICLGELDRIANAAALAIEDLGVNAVPIPADSPYDYWNAQELEGRGILSIRHCARLAGLGSMGKNTLIINERYGNRLGFGVILLDADLPSDPAARELCIPGCRICIDSCPQNALDGGTANQKRCRPHTYSTNARGFSLCNCNTCRTVCPRADGVG